MIFLHLKKQMEKQTTEATDGATKATEATDEATEATEATDEATDEATEATDEATEATDDRRSGQMKRKNARPRGSKLDTAGTPRARSTEGAGPGTSMTA